MYNRVYKKYSPDYLVITVNYNIYLKLILLSDWNTIPKEDIDMFDSNFKDCDESEMHYLSINITASHKNFLDMLALLLEVDPSEVVMLLLEAAYNPDKEVMKRISDISKTKKKQALSQSQASDISSIGSIRNRKA